MFCVAKHSQFVLSMHQSIGPGKRGHIVADTSLLMMFLGRTNERDTNECCVSMLRKLGNICCGHKMVLNKIRNIFCVRNKCCARGQTGKHFNLVPTPKGARMEYPGNEVGNICDGNNVSATMCPRLQGPYDFDFGNCLQG